jgi:small subunit ribosomal protein S8
MVSDYISDLATRLRNGYMAKLSSVIVKNSRISREILFILQKLGFISSFKIIDVRYISVNLSYYRNEPAIRFVRRISKSSNRVYLPLKSLSSNSSSSHRTNKFLILSTNKGVVTDLEALLLGVGGEVLLEIS